MPEYSEVRLTAEYINSVNENRVIRSVEYLPTNRLKFVEEIRVSGKRMSAKSRGKEIRLLFNNEYVTISLGMSGKFKLLHHKPDYESFEGRHSHIRFQLDDGSFFVWHDYRRFGRCTGITWGKDRGPDIFDEEELFRKNILDNLNHKDFNKPSYEVLMNQKWFNGIGNYLRAEILGKWGVNPFQPMKNIVSNEFLDHLIKQVQESYVLGGGSSYGLNLVENKNYSWNDWIKFYGKGEKIKDRQKRTFWFDSKWLSYA
jgi:endonuclease VIII-like 1